MIVKTIGELYRVFGLLNKSFFKGELEEPIILVQSKRKNILGTCSVNRIWEHRGKDNKSKFEITISAEHINRTIEEIVATLLHEMVHLHNSLKDIKDTSNNFVYHNKKFKHEAELRGLIITHAKTIGWSVTTLKEETKQLIKTFNIDEGAFEYYRKSFPGGALKKPAKRNKYECPDCKTTISSTKKLNLICGDCKAPFEMVDELLGVGKNG